jgi:hypothetical protein
MTGIVLEKVVNVLILEAPFMDKKACKRRDAIVEKIRTVELSKTNRNPIRLNEMTGVSEKEFTNIDYVIMPVGDTYQGFIRGEIESARRKLKDFTKDGYITGESMPRVE